MSYNVPVCIDSIESIARDSMSSVALGYFNSGANNEQTKQDNTSAFNKYRFHPRVLRDVTSVCTETTILGRKVKTPLGIAPCSIQQLAHKDGELATSRAAASHGSIMILSTHSSTSLEKVVAEGCGNTDYWFQLYVYKQRKISETIVRRAEKAGFKALVLTVDTPVLGRRLPDARNKFTMPPYLRYANFIQEDNPRVFDDYAVEMSKGSTGAVSDAIDANEDLSLSWENSVAWLKSITNMPIILKGIMTAEDTRLAIEHGCAGVIVSNHGGRQLDGVLATIDALPEVVEAAEDRIEVYFDSGVRKGSDIFKALALGARAVFVGRPAIWGLAYNGEEGVKLVLDLLQNEFELAMRLNGTVSIPEIDDSYLYEPEQKWVRCSDRRKADKQLKLLEPKL